jgi:dTDP-4-dehydrorhamnose 3,5-epimerase
LRARSLTDNDRSINTAPLVTDWLHRHRAGRNRMKVEALAITDVKIVESRVFDDARGTFSESWNRRAFAGAGIVCDFVQDNYVWSSAKGTVRGLHFQAPPYTQGKLVRVTKGAVYDVALDLRRNSPSFGQHVGALLSASNGKQIWVPQGFAHGYVTLEPDTEVFYKVTDYYAPEAEGGVLWNDPALAIVWPLDGSAAILSDKDVQLPPLRDLASPF